MLLKKNTVVPNYSFSNPSDNDFKSFKKWYYKVALHFIYIFQKNIWNFKMRQLEKEASIFLH